MSEKHAVNVTEEAANEFYGNFRNLPDALRKRISAEMLNNIFKTMVVPAIDKARSLDRNQDEFINGVASTLAYILDNGEAIPEEELQRIGSIVLEKHDIKDKS